jgi:hypothetical protein
MPMVVPADSSSGGAKRPTSSVGFMNTSCMHLETPYIRNRIDKIVMSAESIQVRCIQNTKLILL